MDAAYCIKSKLNDNFQKKKGGCFKKPFYEVSFQIFDALEGDNEA